MVFLIIRKEFIFASDENNDDDVKYPVSTGWVQKVLDKNLTREETVNQLLKVNSIKLFSLCVLSTTLHGHVYSKG